MPSKHIVVCVSGYSGSGKDEFARPLVDDGDPKIGLADPAKRHMADVYGFTEEQLFGPSASRNAGDLRYPKSDFLDLGLAPSMVSSESPPDGLIGILQPGVRYWEYLGRSSGLAERLPYLPDKLGSARIFVNEGHPSFWLSPREALQRYCELMNLMYGDTWIRKALDTHQKLGRTVNFRGRDYMRWHYDRMVGVREDAKELAPGPDESFVSCSADFRHWNEIRLTHASATDSFVPVLVRVKRASVPKPPFDHRSETEMATIPDTAFDYVVHNDGTVAELHDACRSVLREASSPSWAPKRHL